MPEHRCSLLFRGYGEYPERRDICLDPVTMWWRKYTWTPRLIERLRMRRFPEHVDHAADRLALATMEQEQLESRMLAFRRRSRVEGLHEGLLPEGFALVRELATRVLDMRHRDVQLMAGWALVHRMIAEVNTGEGKTLAATLAAGVSAWAGMRVHVITSNDYLAARDAKLMRALYRAMGLTCAHVVHAMPHGERKRAYQADVVYVAAKEVVFDYLRDRLVTGARERSLASNNDRRVLRGLVYAIVDEADSVLIDEARTPLIISELGECDAEEDLAAALACARHMQSGRHFRIGADLRADFTGEGEHVLASWMRRYYHGGRFYRFRELIVQALVALYVLQRNHDYLVQDGKVVIVDEHSGRPMLDRSWERGLQQLVEMKEGVKPSRAMRTRIQCSYQEFFQRYLNLSGMSGTVREVCRECWMVYRLPFVRVPPHRPRQCKKAGVRVFADCKDKRQAVVALVRRLQETGRPVLVGAASVASSEAIGKAIRESGISCKVLNARQDAHEAEVIAKAGQRGAVTIATSMAGRGTDIPVERAALDAGGLHVILTELHDSSRVDRQLIGRTGRQGDPGSYELLLSLEDSLCMRFLRLEFLGQTLARVLRGGQPVAMIAAYGLMKALQKWVERSDYKARCRLIRHQKKLYEMLAFSGHREVL